MWADFFKPLLEEFKNSDDYDEKTYNEAYTLLYEAIYRTGDPHSFRCVWVWIRTRVRFWELVPTWEIRRIAKDTEFFFDKIKEFRNKLINHYGLSTEDTEQLNIYSESQLKKYEGYRDEQIAFLTEWADAENDVEFKLKDSEEGEDPAY